jgi:glycerophosphoryl diester phosphodiesterase
VLRIVRRSWPQLLAVDLIAKALGVLVVAPVSALLLRWLSARRGSAVLTDEAILWFALSPGGVVALVAVGAVLLWILFVEHGVIVTVAHATARGQRVTVRWAYGVVTARSAAMLQFAAGLIVRLLVVASPFVALGALAYVSLLTEFDINYYLAIRPPAFWLAGTLMGILGATLALVVLLLLVRWVVAVPILLFERTSVPRAFRGSLTRTRSHRWSIAVWLGVWAAAALGSSSAVTGIVGAVGRFVVPAESGSLTVVALAIGVAVVVAVGLNVLVSIAVVSLLGVLVERVYSTAGGSGLPDARFMPRSESRSDRRARVGTMRAFVFGLVLTVVIVTAVATVVVSTLRVQDVTAITAHRGSSAEAPENTLAAFERAIAEGADWIEIDVQELADGTVAVVHDRDLKRLGGVTIVVPQATYDDVRAIDVGSWFDPVFAGERIPTLAEVLNVARGRARVNVELKYYGPLGTLAERVIGIVEDESMEQEVVLMSLKQEAVRQAKALRPDWTVGLLTAVALGNAARLEADFLAVSTSLATRSFIRAAHGRGRAVHVWTVNDPVQMSVLMSRGVDNIITDVPAVARAVMAERETMTAVERLLVEVGAWLGVIEVANVTNAEPGS